MSKISIIIKALNEEKNIEKCIKSALRAIKGMKGDVILVDSISTDKTIEIASKFPIKIIQLKNKKDRRCGIGPQIGYLFSLGDYLYILDGDMELDKDFIKKALPFFEDKKVAGVGGNIIENSEKNLAFQSRIKEHVVDSVDKVKKLGMGGLYKRAAIKDVGYFSNPYFYAYEEFDLGQELIAKGYSLLRIPEKMVTHYGDNVNSYSIMINRLKSKYLFGSGQCLRHSIARGRARGTISELKIYLVTLIWILMALITTLKIEVFVTFIGITFLGLLIKKKSISKLFFSVFAWNIQALGLVLGLIRSQKDPLDFKPEIKIIK